MNAPTREIAEHVSKSSGQMFTTTDIRNRINKYNSEIHGDENDINDFFNDIIKDGGNVAAKYDENKRVRVLLVQTRTQFKALSEAKPNLFFTDTTFLSFPFLILFLICVTIGDSQRVDWVESESS